MSDKQRGLYGKFSVGRTDGTDAPGKKHDGCEYFVLDLTHDDYAIPALIAYAKACRKEYPALAADLDRIVARHDAARALARIQDDPRSMPRRPSKRRAPTPESKTPSISSAPHEEAR